MPIVALPTNTVHAIGSSQVLTDSASLVKELVENALDGRATAIFVEISTNALDIVQVKDNGHGIAPGDRGMLCRRYCTSKIRDLEDLTKVGGQSLGFRGEALASAAEMSGSVIISTRVEGEPTATSIKVRQQGGIESEEKTSHPVGTTVRVGDFLKDLPVRRQTALKAPAKLLSKIKKMLHAYALSRPSIRFSLRVLKAKNDKGNWMYAPRSGTKGEDALNDAAIKVVGKKAVEQSAWIDWSSASMNDQTTNTVGRATGNEVYRIEAFLPVSACDTSSVSNIGHFVSVDSRPVSCARGTLKQMISLYKSYIRSASSSSDGPNLVDPFLCMNIFCPPGSYDVNVEPAKDDVLFTDNVLFLKVIENFFISVYGDLRKGETEDVHSRTSKPRSQGFELLLAKKTPLSVAAVQEQDVEGECSSVRIEHPHSAISEMQNKADSISSAVPDPEAQLSDPSVRSPQTATRSTSPQTSPTARDLPRNNAGPLSESTAGVRRRPWNRNTYFDDDDSIDELHRNLEGQTKTSGATDHANEDALRDVTVSNPWTFAKLNAPIRSLRSGHKSEAARNTDGQLFTPVGQRGEAIDPDGLGRHNHNEHELLCGLPTPEGSRAAVPSTTRLQSSSPEPFPYPLKAWGKGEGSRIPKKSHGLDRDPCSSGALDTWVQKPMANRMSTPSNDEISPPDCSVTAANRPRDFISARTLPIGTPLSDIPRGAGSSSRKAGPRKQQQSGVNKPFVSPVNDPERVWFNMEPKRRSKPTRPAQSDHVKNSIAANTPTLHDSDDDDSIAELPSSAASAGYMHPELASMMDYELRKQAALDQRKKYLRQQAAAAAKALNRNATEQSPRSQNSRTSPHKNRYHKAIAALVPSDEHSPERSAVFEPGDPRAYLIRIQQRDNAEHQTTPAGASPVKKRRKTTMLPLETISDDRSSTRNLSLKLNTTPQELENRISQAATVDEYIRAGTISSSAFAAAPKIQQVRIWEAKLETLIERSYRKKPDVEGVGMRIDLWVALQSHLDTHL